MEISQIIPHVESLIFAADRPLPTLEITDLLNNAMAFLEDRATLDQVEAALEAVREKYSSEFYAFEVRESGGGYQFLTKKDYYQTVAQLNGEKFLKRLSTAALETLAIIAYKQPISKGEIEHIRGVATDYSIQKLLEKELIVITGRSEQLPGKPLIYGTSKAFMDYFGLNSPKDLPKLKEVFEEDVAPTLMLDLDANGNTIDEPLNMIVSETGELVEQIELPDGEALSPVIAGVVSDETLERLDIDVPGGIEHISVDDEPVAEEEPVSEDIIEAPEAIADIEEEIIVTEEIQEIVVASVGPGDEEDEDDEDSDEEDEDDIDEDEDSEDEDNDEDEDDEYEK
ncbi:SMC-Scp complex subunit ScpB [Chitinophaga oryziterrae]|uniref:SMC-Scp complex subunit ScpB n=2 Tax=Chitinophaga oryziterrae TaxID=1031224 RepID=A0A6N8J1Y0_9BACT|nr:SMC-Scp complex subunit ScpB [Chitinophaga oryziterrae]MVT38964.1 SMC-Scp complex subunit ScpB [Chitinophaga oryziterrae]